jgi:hypothetical protein
MNHFPMIHRLSVWGFTVLLFLLAATLSLSPARADLITYTYTSSEFTRYFNSFQSYQPPAGSSLSISFVHDGPLPVGQTTITSFTLSCGELQYNAPGPDVALSSGYVVVPEGGGGFVEWRFDILAAPYPNYPYWQFGALTVPSSASTGTWYTHDFAIYRLPGGHDPFARLLIDYGAQPPAWTSVPVPSAVLLLGSGLIPLAWFRRRNRLGR